MLKKGPAHDITNKVVADWFDDPDRYPEFKNKIGDREWTRRLVLAAVRKALSAKPGKVTSNRWRQT